MPRRRRRSSSPSDLMMTEDDEDLMNHEACSPLGSDKCPPQQRNAANARERARMRVLSKAFCRLKTTLPWVPADTKLSKLDTLRLASGYIAHLRALLADQPPEDMQQSGRPLNLSWPFTFQQGISVPWMSSTISPGRVTPPITNIHATNRINHTNYQSNYHPENSQHHDINFSNMDNNNINLNDNNKCDSDYHNNYYNRNGYYPQEEGNNDYYNQIHRDNYARQSYSESMIHTG